MDTVKELNKTYIMDILDYNPIKFLKFRGIFTLPKIVNYKGHKYPLNELMVEYGELVTKQYEDMINGIFLKNDLHPTSVDFLKSKGMIKFPDTSVVYSDSGVHSYLLYQLLDDYANLITKDTQEKIDKQISDFITPEKQQELIQYIIDNPYKKRI